MKRPKGNSTKPTKQGKAPEKAQKRRLVPLIAALLVAVLAAAAFHFRRRLFDKTPLLENPTTNEVVYANATANRAWKLTCSQGDYLPRSKGCSPDFCARFIRNNFTSLAEVESIRSFAESVMRFGGGSGGPTIFDAHRGALSMGDKFLDIYAKLSHLNESPFAIEDVEMVRRVVDRIRSTIMETFGLSELYLTSPTFFSRITAGLKPKIANDEYWHPHIDKLAYGSFIYTSLLYLSDFGEDENHSDFEGGEFVFYNDKERKGTTIVQPVKGRLSIFTSGAENVHFVNKVTRGTRCAFTVAFTCDKKLGITHADFLNRAIDIAKKYQ